MEAAGEGALIAQYLRPHTHRHPGAFALLDDAAALAVPEGHELVVTADALAEGVHFLADDPAETLAVKALSVNISDLVAKGAAPFAYFLTLALPERCGEAWLSCFAMGLGRVADGRLAGGDLIRTRGPLTLSVTALGLVPEGRMVRREGAKPGEEVFVSGLIGSAYLGLKCLVGESLGAVSSLDDSSRARLVGRYREPVVEMPERLAEGVRGVASAALDVSDGLILDAQRLALVSGVAIDIEAERVPVDPAAERLIAEGAVVREALFTGGDDYCVLLTSPLCAQGLQAHPLWRERPPVSIGRVVDGPAGHVRLLDKAGNVVSIPRSGHDHFRKGGAE